MVGELCDPENVEVPRQVSMDGGHRACRPASIGRSSVAKGSPQVRPSAAEAELLDFDGDEGHSAGQPTLTGRDHFDAQLAFADYAAFRSCVWAKS